MPEISRFYGIIITMMYLVKEIVDVQPYVLTLKFNTGEILEVNLEDKLKKWSKSPNSLYKQLLDPDYFKSVKLEPDWETIYWDNGLDFCPDVLYSLGKTLETSPITASAKVLDNPTLATN